VKKRSIALALCCAFLCAPVSAKTFVGVLYPLFGPVAAFGLGNTQFRIHGTNQPSTIGSFVSSGCIRLTNDDVADLYNRVTIGTTVVVLPGANTAASQLLPRR
jgi:L,D-transpeptidase-like protein